MSSSSGNLHCSSSCWHTNRIHVAAVAAAGSYCTVRRWRIFGRTHDAAMAPTHCDGVGRSIDMRNDGARPIAMELVAGDSVASGWIGYHQWHTVPYNTIVLSATIVALFPNPSDYRRVAVRWFLVDDSVPYRTRRAAILGTHACLHGIEESVVVRSS